MLRILSALRRTPRKPGVGPAGVFYELSRDGDTVMATARDDDDKLVMLQRLDPGSAAKLAQDLAALAALAALAGWEAHRAKWEDEDA